MGGVDRATKGPLSISWPRVGGGTALLGILGLAAAVKTRDS